MRTPEFRPFANNCSKRWARTLTDEFKSGACHAGQYETSLVLASKPDTVKKEVASGLAANDTSLSWAIREGRQILWKRAVLTRTLVSLRTEP